MAVEAQAGTRRPIAWSRHLATFGPWVLLIVLMIIATSLSSSFARPRNLLNILRQASPLAIVAMGQTLVILIGGIDVSVGAVVSLTTVIGGSVMANSDAMILPTVLICLAVGLVIGTIHSLLIVRLGADPFVTTLGSMLILDGLNLIYTGGAPRSQVTDLFRKLAQGEIGGVPIIIPLVAVLAGVLIVALRRTTWGRRLYSVGGNEAASRLSGVRTARIRGSAYILCSLLSVVAGIVLLARIGTGATAAGTGLELDSIAAVLIGGTVFGGGKGGISGTIAGVLILTVLFNISNLLAIDNFAQLIIKGVVIIVGIALYSRRTA
jgi:ribose transport system permease protein